LGAPYRPSATPNGFHQYLFARANKERGVIASFYAKVSRLRSAGTRLVPRHTNGWTKAISIGASSVHEAIEVMEK
jgi:hypothetical protein